MSRVLKFTTALLVTLAVVACSSTPKQAATPATTTRTASAATPANASAATNTAAAPVPSAQAGSAAPGQPDSQLLSRGYRAVKFKNDYVYCRMESVTGTQFKKRVCLTAEAIRDLDQNTQETQDSMTKQRTGPACFPGVNC